MGCDFSRLSVKPGSASNLNLDSHQKNKDCAINANTSVPCQGEMNQLKPHSQLSPNLSSDKNISKKNETNESVSNRGQSKTERLENIASAKLEYFSGTENRRKNQSLLQNLVHEEYRKTITEVYDLAGGKRLGSGGFGTVQVVTRRATGKQFALKTVELNRVKDKRNFDFFTKEIEIMKNLDHPNIVRLQEVFHTPQYIFMVMDLCTGGNLLQSYKFKTEREAALIIKSIVNAIRYCHDRGIAHRDLKLDNIIYEHDGPDAVVKLVDFGLSCYTSEAHFEHDVVGTWIYMAPEVIKGYHAPTACDMWSIGVISYLLLCGYPPFTGENREKLKWQITHGTYRFHEAAWAKISSLGKSFITRLLVRNPQERMTAAEAQHHPWLSKKNNGLDTTLPPEVAANIVKFRDANLLTKLALKTVARAMEVDQVYLLEKEFSKADSQDAGVITMSDLRLLLKNSLKNAETASQEGVASIFRRNSESRRSITLKRASICQEELQTIFSAADLDSNGSLSLNDFIAASMSQRALDDQRLKLAFDRLDFDHNGQISLNDLELVVGSDCNGAELMTAISDFDFNGDGMIDFSEFCKAMRHENVGVLDMATIHRKSLASQVELLSLEDVRALVEQGTSEKFIDFNSQHIKSLGLDEVFASESEESFNEIDEANLGDAVRSASIIRSAALLPQVNQNHRNDVEHSVASVVQSKNDPNETILNRTGSKVIRSLFNSKTLEAKALPP